MLEKGYHKLNYGEEEDIEYIEYFSNDIGGFLYYLSCNSLRHKVISIYSLIIKINSNPLYIYYNFILIYK